METENLIKFERAKAFELDEVTMYKLSLILGLRKEVANSQVDDEVKQAHIESYNNDLKHLLAIT